MSIWVEEAVADTIDQVETYPDIPYEPWDVWSEEEGSWNKSLW